MRKILIAITTAVVISVVGGQAAVARTGIRFNRTTIYWGGAETIGGPFGLVICPVTATITLHQTVAKIRGALMGLANLGYSTSSCITGNAGQLVGNRRVTGLAGPYHVQFQSFDGTLPNITSISFAIVGVSFWITEPTFGVSCLTAGPQSITATTTGGNPATGLSISAASIALEGGFGCGFSSATMTAEGSLYAELALRSRSSVTITLI